VWATLPELLAEGKPLESTPSDWTRATVAELFFAVEDEARTWVIKKAQRDSWALGWAMLEEICKSPTASPMLWYEGVFFDVGQELRVRGEREALKFFKKALAHNLYHDEGSNADSCLRDLAETYLWVGDLDVGLRILTGLLHNDPADIWTYNLMAITFDHFGLTEIGAEAARRGVDLVEATGDPEKLRDQFLDALDRMQESEHRGREAEVDPAVLADLRAVLALEFDAGEHRPTQELCYELVPDLEQVPVKRLPEKPNLPPPDTYTKQQQTPTPHRRSGRRDSAAKDKRTERLCKRDGFPLVKIDGRRECVAEFLDRCIGGQRIVDVTQRDETIYYVFEGGHELPLLCFCCGTPLSVENPRTERRHMRGRRLESMSVEPVLLNDGTEMLQFRLEFSKKRLEPSGRAVAVSVESAAQMHHPPGCPHVARASQKTPRRSKRRKRKRKR
jgi:tetratricopeptide (TPR) repeat protein